MTLQSIFEQDRERLLQSMSGAPASEIIRIATQELDRVLYVYNQQTDDVTVLEAANAMIQTAKAAAGLIDTAGEARIYGRTDYPGGTTKVKNKLPVFFWLILAAGLLCAAGSVWLILRIRDVIPSLIPAGQAQGLPAWAWYLILPGAAMILLFLAGMSVRLRSRSEQLHAELTTDPQKVYNRLLSMILVMDRSLEDIASASGLKEKERIREETAAMDPAETELLASLLEDAYSRRDTDEQAAEAISQIKYYLHGRHIDVIDWKIPETGKDRKKNDTDQAAEPDRRGWFDMLPAYGAGTIRPALASDGKLLKKGLASEGRR